MQNRLLAACVALLFTVSGVHAHDSVDAKLKSKLEQRLPGIKVQAVHALSWSGVYEVITSDEIIYADASGDHLIVGKMMDTATHSNLTEERWNEVNKIDFDRLPFEQAIRIVKGNGVRKLAIFEDPYCPYCQQLEHTLETIDNVTIYVFLYPLEDLHPGATQAAQAIWCAPNKNAAWLTWMQSRKAPTDNCDETPIAALATLGRTLKINSTPTLIFGDGQRVPGAIDAEKIEARLNKAAH